MTIDRSRPVHTGTASVRASTRLSLLGLAAIVVAPMAALAAPGAAKLPKAFDAYATTSVDGGDCVAGNTTREGMTGRAYVYFRDASTGEPRWVTAIPLGEDLYQNRATHCIAMGGSLYVLVQSDTSQASSLSQTMLNVVELSPADGKILADRYADVPGVNAAYSSWVDKGNEGFHAEHGRIEVKGHYFLMSDPEKRLPFTAALPARSPK